MFIVSVAHIYLLRGREACWNTAWHCGPAGAQPACLGRGAPVAPGGLSLKAFTGFGVWVDGNGPGGWSKGWSSFSTVLGASSGTPLGFVGVLALAAPFLLSESVTNNCWASDTRQARSERFEHLISFTQHSPELGIIINPFKQWRNWG